jgi:uncharacterized membrane protein YfcA
MLDSLMADLPARLAEIAPFIAIGFAAQIVDGALGMAFGVITQTLLVSVVGVAPAAASASVHLVELFTTGTSGLSHIWHRNVNWGLFWRLVPTGIVGGVTGAYLLSSIDASVAKPFVMIYLAGIGVYLLFRAIRMRKPSFEDPRFTAPLALAGGFLDAAGGGGWGPIVTSNLLVQGVHPRKVIGTVNTAEFFLSVTISATFILTLGAESFTKAMVGLLIGGLAAAPLGGFAAKRIPARALLIMVGIVLTVTSAYGIYTSLKG